MPNIPAPYDAPPQDTELRPSETGIDALQQAARRTGAFYEQAGQDMSQIGARGGSAIAAATETGIKSIQAHETATGAKNYADMLANLTASWNDTAKKADPNDAGAAARWRANVMEPALQQFAEKGFITEGGQQFAESHVAALRDHLVEKTTADMSTLAGVAATTNFAQTTNKLAASVHLDPSSLDFALKTADSSLGAIVDSSPTLSATDAARVKSEALLRAREGIVKSAVIGMIEKNPDTDLSAINEKYGQYLKPGEMEVFERQAKAQAKANLYYDKQAALLQKQQADLSVHKQSTDLLANSVTVDPSNPNHVMVAPDFMKKALDIARNNPDAPSAAAAVRTMIDWGESQNRERATPVVDNPQVKADLLQRLTDPNKPLTKMDVLGAEAKGDLSSRTGTLYRQMVDELGPSLLKDPLAHTALAAASERLGVTSLIDGHERYANFMQSFLPEYERQKRAGTLAPNALDLSDEKSLIRQSLKQFEPDPRDRLAAHLAKTLGMPIPAAGPTPGAPNAPSPQSGGPRFVPPTTWQWSGSRQQYRDPATNKVYDLAGHEVK